MPYSYNDVGQISPGQTMSVSFPFITRDHVSVTVDEETVSTSLYEWINDGLLKASAGFPLGETRVQRHTPDNALPGALSGSSVFEFDEVNTNDLILLYILQEQADRLNGVGILLGNTIAKLLQEISDRIAADNNEATARADRDAWEMNQRITADNVEAASRIRGDRSEAVERENAIINLRNLIDRTLIQVQSLTAQSVGAAQSSSQSSLVSQQLVQSAISGFQGFRDGNGYDMGQVIDPMTYFNRDFGLITK